MGEAKRHRSTPRYRLDLIEPLFQISEPSQKFRGLTERELDQLAKFLRNAEDALRDYDAEAEPLLAAITAINDPWWDELRPELLRRGEDAQWLDEQCSSCYGTKWLFGGDGDSVPDWVGSLMFDIVQRVDPAPYAAKLAEFIRVAGSIDVAKLDSALMLIMTFHPFGMPHQLRIENLAEVFGMRPVASTDEGNVVYGYGKEGAPEKMPWQTGEIRGRIGEVPTKDPEEFLWMPVYEGLLSWIGELIEVLEDRTSSILQTRQDTIEHLHYEVEFLAGFDSASAALSSLAEQLFVLNRLLLGLCEEINSNRRKLIDNLGRVLGAYDGRWRLEKPNGVMLQHYLRIGLDRQVLP